MLMIRTSQTVAFAGILFAALFVTAAMADSSPESGPDLSAVSRAGIRVQPIGRSDPLWWAFQPLWDATTPPLSRELRFASPVDSFIWAELGRAGLTLNPPADKGTLLRRVTFDLTGLPPSPEEIEAFASDNSPGAFAQVVERLLASPHYGERWGRHWLDVARYADTAGETADYPVLNAYRYRDYVIDAFNRDVPYHEFIREQIAGDILARNAVAAGEIDRRRYSQLITATGYLAISRRFGFDTERYEHLTIQDTLDTLGQSVLGLSLGCARCHDHKYDPVSMDEYYGLYGIFASTRYAFAGSERLQTVRSGVPLVPPAEASEGWLRWDREVSELEKEFSQLTSRYRELKANDADSVAGNLAPLNKLTIRALTEIDGDFELQAPPQGGSLGLPANPWQFTGPVQIERAAQSPYTHIRQSGGSGASFEEGESDYSLRQAFVSASGAKTDPLLHLSFDFRLVESANAPSGSIRIQLGNLRTESAAVELFISLGQLSVRNGSAVEAVHSLQPGIWHQVQLELNLNHRVYSGSVSAPGELSRFGGKLFLKGWQGNLDLVQIDSRGDLTGSRPGLHLDNFVISKKPFPTLPGSASTDAVTGERRAIPDAELQPDQVKQRIDAVRRQLDELLERGPFPMAYAVWEGTPHDVPIQKRGEPSLPGEVVPRQFLHILRGGTLPEEVEGSGRLELANWLVNSAAPLTARVMANRIWQHHFGNGLAPDENEFGTRAQPPSHPELLSYLAGRFIDEGWSIKAMHRLILLSQTYQQASGATPQAVRIDPDNRLLSHFPRRRLDAESIRDAILATSGRLELGTSGPHPFPKSQHLAFTQHDPFRAVYDSNRRSIYLMTQRIKRHPYLALFDGADPNASTAERSTTTVPTQALFMMNDPFIHEQSQAFARRLLDLATNDAARVARAFQLALGRAPDTQELEDSIAFVRLYQKKISAVVQGADVENEVWAAFARTLFARNEFVYIN